MSKGKKQLTEDEALIEEVEDIIEETKRLFCL